MLPLLHVFFLQGDIIIFFIILIMVKSPYNTKVSRCICQFFRRFFLDLMSELCICLTKIGISSKSTHGYHWMLQLLNLFVMLCSTWNLSNIYTKFSTGGTYILFLILHFYVEKNLLIDLFSQQPKWIYKLISS